MTLSLSQPIDRDWTEIYLYGAGRTCKRWGKVEVSADINVQSLNEYQAKLLDRLKAWLYGQRVASRSARHRPGKLAKLPLCPADEQPALFEF